MTKDVNKLLGVILCGGQSKRMGSDKGLLQNDGQVWVKIIAEKLASLAMPVVVSINEHQRESYASLFPSKDLIVDSITIQGPLKGLLSVHQAYPDRDILLMACDLIDMDNQTLTHLIDKYNSENFDFFVYQENYAEPFCAIYTSGGLKPVLERAKERSLSEFSFQTILNEGKTLRIPITKTSSFRNYNTIPGHHRESS
jgi:molybdenum cofactor guanylyltransferase